MSTGEEYAIANTPASRPVPRPRPRPAAQTAETGNGRELRHGTFLGIGTFLLLWGAIQLCHPFTPWNHIGKYNIHPTYIHNTDSEIVVFADCGNYFASQDIYDAFRAKHDCDSMVESHTAYRAFQIMSALLLMAYGARTAINDNPGMFGWPKHYIGKATRHRFFFPVAAIFLMVHFILYVVTTAAVDKIIENVEEEIADEDVGIDFARVFDGVLAGGVFALWLAARLKYHFRAQHDKYAATFTRFI